MSLNTAAKKEINYFKSLYEEEAQENESLRQMVYQIEQNYTNAHTSDRSYGSINSGKKYIATTPIQVLIFFIKGSGEGIRIDRGNQ